MINGPPYTLEQLAEDFELTPRTARHYVENVLPGHHKKGRGKLARYGQDTWNCFAFIQKARVEKLTTAQIAGVLADLDQAQIDRVAEGMEVKDRMTSKLKSLTPCLMKLASANRNQHPDGSYSTPTMSYK